MPKNWEQRERKRRAKGKMPVHGQSVFMAIDAEKKRDEKFIDKMNKKYRKENK